MHPSTLGENNRSRTFRVSQWHVSCGLFLETFGGWAQLWEALNRGGEPQAASPWLGSCTERWWPAPFALWAAVSLVPDHLKRLEAVTWVNKTGRACASCLAFPIRELAAREQDKRKRIGGFVVSERSEPFVTVKQKIHAQSSSSLNKAGNRSLFRTKQGPGCGNSTPHPYTCWRNSGSQSSRLSSTRWSQCCQEQRREAVVSEHPFPFLQNETLWEKSLWPEHVLFFQLPSRAPGGTADSQLTRLSPPCKLVRRDHFWDDLKKPRDPGTQTKASFRSEVTEAMYSLWGVLHALQVGHSVNPVL